MQWEENKHPRDDDGKFTNKNSLITSAQRNEIEKRKIIEDISKTLTDKKWEESLTPQQKKAIRAYTAYSKRLNNLLRDRKADLSNQYAEMADLIDSAIEQYELKQPIRVYRKVSRDEAAKGYFEDKGFTSTSIDKDFIKKIATKDDDAIYIFDIPPRKGLGAYINNLASPNFKNTEYEFLMRSHLEFKEYERYKIAGRLYVKWRLVDDE